MENLSILCVDDDQNIVQALRVILEKSGYSVFTACNGFEALKIMETESVDCAIIDYKMPQMDGFGLLKKIREINNSTEVFILTGHGTIPNAVESIKLGAFDYILKPFHKDDLLNHIEKIVRIKKLRQENSALKSQLKERYKFDNLIGSAPKMVEIFETIRKVADSNSPVLILGETGTGKEEIAKAIHYSGNRNQKKFSIIDCASINSNLFESELFGHVKGSFTGAIADKTGLLKAAGDGTVFLDEIADIPVYIQVKLLRAIEEKTFKPVGSVESQKFGARIIAATSKNIREAIEIKEFREDLFYRLSVVVIEIPPLQERKDDIPLLIRHFIHKHDNNKNRTHGVSEKALEILIGYNWPGNVRELENCIERAFALGAQEVIDVKDLPSSLISRDRDPDNMKSLETPTFSDFEKEALLQTLKSTQGNKRLAAQNLKIGLATLYRKMKKYNLE